MSKNYAHKDWPAWRYGPDGKGKVFNTPDEVPDGWTDVSPKAAAAGAVPAAPKAKAPAKEPDKEPTPEEAAKAAADAQAAADKKAAAAAAKAEKKAAAKAKDTGAAFDREAAIAELVKAGYDVEGDTTDAEIKAALEGLKKG